ncbi:hypothetical protein SKPV-WA-164 [Skunkpox virus]|uniref:CPXV181 protein n=1 Tax=Skunkpox virus TaxID=160796 RepID=A0A1C9KBW2_9POXV|nr:hypothetical protein BIZ96_gp164 [Skunkpox virus]AOP31643.1 hypothetical protein SKPV-WA-164 [Skunkpox virus]
MDKIKITIDSKVSNVITISYSLEKITIDVAPKKKKEKEPVQIITVDEEKDPIIKTDEKDIIEVTDDDMDVENSQ